MTDTDLRWDTGSEERGLVDVDRERLEVEAESGVPRCEGGGPIPTRKGLAIDVLARTPVLELNDFLRPVSVLSFVIPVAELGRGRGTLGVANAAD